MNNLPQILHKSLTPNPKSHTLITPGSSPPPLPPSAPRILSPYCCRRSARSLRTVSRRSGRLRLTLWRTASYSWRRYGGLPAGEIPNPSSLFLNPYP